MIFQATIQHQTFNTFASDGLTVAGEGRPRERQRDPVRAEGETGKMVQFGEHMRQLNPIPDGLREKWERNDLVPLWETGNLFAPSREKPRLWQWSVLRPILLETATITDPAIIERRVMQLVNASVEVAGGDATVGLMNAAVQALRPGETAAPHRHSINALRFVLEGDGAETIVNGEACRMSAGDLILTPAWAWHEHRNGHDQTVLWLDILDANLHHALGYAQFQPGPPDTASDQGEAMFNWPSIVPEGVAAPSRPATYRYPWRDAVRALDAAPARADRSRLVRYVNPLTGGSCLPLIDCLVLQLAAGAATDPSKAVADIVVSVAEGSGHSKIGEAEFAWSAHDIFTIPKHAVATHTATGSGARLFLANNQEVYRRLGLLQGP
jgi:gentisate 1,2-dioxygenase